MIFVTVGAQMPFDRLVRAVDVWAGRHTDTEVYAQIGASDLCPVHMGWARYLEPARFRERVEAATFIVSHAGTGSIISALGHAKPILIMPRHAALRETRNDHQIATAERFRHRLGITVAADETELAGCLDTLSGAPRPERMSPDASGALLDAIRTFIAGSGERAGSD